MKSLKLKQRAQRGFTLIELMIVVAIIGILAAIALPAYQTYIIKSKLVEATTDLDAAKIAVSEAYATDGGNSWGNTNMISLSSNHKFVSGIKYNPGTATPGGGGTGSIVVTLAGTGNTNIDSKFLGIFGTGQTDGSITWKCGTATAATDVTVGAQTAMYPYIPSTCQS